LMGRWRPTNEFVGAEALPFRQDVVSRSAPRGESKQAKAAKYDTILS
jgi:hypothetical protein